MNKFWDFAFLASMFSPIAALLAIPIVFACYRTRPVVGGLAGFILLLASSFITGLLAGFGGMMAGILGFCIYAASAQCGLGGIFLTGPLAFSLGVAIILYQWARRMKQSNR